MANNNNIFGDGAHKNLRGPTPFQHVHYVQEYDAEKISAELISLCSRWTKELEAAFPERVTPKNITPRKRQRQTTSKYTDKYSGKGFAGMNVQDAIERLEDVDLIPVVVKEEKEGGTKQEHVLIFTDEEGQVTRAEFIN